MPRRDPLDLVTVVDDDDGIHDRGREFGYVQSKGARAIGVHDVGSRKGVGRVRCARSGKTETLLTKPGAYTFPRLSFQRDRLAVNVTDSGVMRTEIYDLQRPAEPIRLPMPGSMSTAWHPDGFLVLGSFTGMSWLKINDPSKLETLTPSPNVQLPMSITADGTHLVYLEAAPSLDIWTIPIHHTDGKLIAGKPEPFLKTPEFESAPSFSPDGRWLAYARGRGPKWDVFVRPFPRDDSKEINLSRGGGRVCGGWGMDANSCTGLTTID